MQIGPDGGVANSVIVKVGEGYEVRKGPVALPPGYYIVPPP